MRNVVGFGTLVARWMGWREANERLYRAFGNMK